ncbi:MAG: hypothetical protein U0132_24185 [Gemmatimonadaceae bacterium]
MSNDATHTTTLEASGPSVGVDFSLINSATGTALRARTTGHGVGVHASANSGGIALKAENTGFDTDIGLAVIGTSQFSSSAGFSQTVGTGITIDKLTSGNGVVVKTASGIGMQTEAASGTALKVIGKSEFTSTATFDKPFGTAIQVPNSLSGSAIFAQTALGAGIAGTTTGSGKGLKGTSTGTAGVGVFGSATGGGIAVHAEASGSSTTALEVVGQSEFSSTASFPQVDGVAIRIPNMTDGTGIEARAVSGRGVFATVTGA